MSKSSPCGESLAVYPNIFNLRLFRNFPVSAGRRVCSRDRKRFPAWKNENYQYGQVAKCSGNNKTTNRGLFSFLELQISRGELL
jgi:hypothetical protein